MATYLTSLLWEKVSVKVCKKGYSSQSRSRRTFDHWEGGWEDGMKKNGDSLTLLIPLQIVEKEMRGIHTTRHRPHPPRRKTKNDRRRISKEHRPRHQSLPNPAAHLLHLVRPLRPWSPPSNDRTVWRLTYTAHCALDVWLWRASWLMLMRTRPRTDHMHVYLTVILVLVPFWFEARLTCTVLFTSMSQIIYLSIHYRRRQVHAADLLQEGLKILLFTPSYERDRQLVKTQNLIPQNPTAPVPHYCVYLNQIKVISWSSKPYLRLHLRAARWRSSMRWQAHVFAVRSHVVCMDHAMNYAFGTHAWKK